MEKTQLCRTMNELGSFILYLAKNDKYVLDVSHTGLDYVVHYKPNKKEG